MCPGCRLWSWVHTEPLAATPFYFQSSCMPLACCALKCAVGRNATALNTATDPIRRRMTAGCCLPPGCEAHTYNESTYATDMSVHAAMASGTSMFAL